MVNWIQVTLLVVKKTFADILRSVQSMSQTKINLYLVWILNKIFRCKIIFFEIMLTLVNLEQNNFTSCMSETCKKEYFALLWCILLFKSRFFFRHNVTLRKWYLASFCCRSHSPNNSYPSKCSSELNPNPKSICTHTIHLFQIWCCLISPKYICHIE